MDLLSEALNDMGSRLFLKIREELGLAYYVGTHKTSRACVPGCFSFYAGTAADDGRPSGGRVAHTRPSAWPRRGLTDEELRRAKAKLIGHKKIARQDSVQRRLRHMHG